MLDGRDMPGDREGDGSIRKGAMPSHHGLGIACHVPSEHSGLGRYMSHMMRWGLVWQAIKLRR